MDLVAIREPDDGQHLIAGLQPLHTLVVSHLGAYRWELYGITR